MMKMNIRESSESTMVSLRGPRKLLVSVRGRGEDVGEFLLHKVGSLTHFFVQ
jgi:hypothetical protein